MIFLIVFLVCLFVVIGTGVLAGLSDIRGLTIPNYYSVIIITAFVVCYALIFVGGYKNVFAPLMSHGLSVVIVFLITLAMFAGKIMGAGDAKLASAFAFWLGIKGLVSFVFYMSLVGGLLAIAALLFKKYKPIAAPRDNSWVAQVQDGESKVPYGVAIVVGALIAFFQMGYFDPALLASFIDGS